MASGNSSAISEVAWLMVFSFVGSIEILRAGRRQLEQKSSAEASENSLMDWLFRFPLWTSLFSEGVFLKARFNFACFRGAF